MPRPDAFAELPASVDLPAIEREVLRRWGDGEVFQRSVRQTAGERRWVCYPGPATAGGMPGVHHIEARVVKDLFPRFKTMQGYHVPRRAGWDCHGLAVEVAVERELGLTAKQDIEAYGIAEFNARCRESVLRHVAAFAAMTERMGYWIDEAAAYWTMDPAYIESVWWSLREIWRQGLLVRDYRISPYCPRCGTPLADHELGLPGVYRTVTDTSVTVRLPLRTLPPGASPELAGADLLVWTTRPWTLVSNTAVAVHPDRTYAVARRSGHGDRVVVADALFARVLGDGWHITERMRGAELAGATYQPPFGLVEIPRAHRVVTGSFVTTRDGTGLVHLAPAFGADDLAAGREFGLPVVNPVGPDGRFEEGMGLVGGLFVKDAESRLIGDLANRGLLLRSQRHEHSCPHCWRCGSALLCYAVASWFIRTTQVTDRLLAQNARTGWHPAAIRDGRYGEWLRGNVDWALSRTRYWGTPLPVWVCPAQHATCVGSLAELSERAGRDLTAIDPHRPDVDDVVIGCPQCDAPARRVPEIIDAWYDSGSMPFAQFGAPWRNEEEFRRSYPAQLICEGIDQTRGWFYSLMAVGTLVQGRSAYENVVCLGPIADERGRTMSRHLGNVLEPVSLMDAHGADAVRWFFAAAGPPWAIRKIGPGVLEEIVRKVLLTYWNSAAFLVLCANAAGGNRGNGGDGGDVWTPARLADAPPAASRPAMDRWLLSELHILVREVTAALEAFDAATAGRRIAAFIDDLSHWYVRRSRRRFWAGPATPGGASAFATLYGCLETLTRLMAPVTPFITDYLWDVLRAGTAPDSVHLSAWPVVDAGLIDEELGGQMALARRLVELGRSARADALLRAAQPLARALVSAAGFASLPGELRAEVCDELSVGALEPLDPVAGGELPRSGWAVATEGGETIALAVTITAELRREGCAREAIQLIQDARQRDGLEVTDRIVLRWATADPELAAALTEHGTLIGAEVLAVDYGAVGVGVTGVAGAGAAEGGAAEGGADAGRHMSADLGLTFWIRKA